LALKDLELKAAYTGLEVAGMFDVSARTIQTWVTEGKLNKRMVPGRAKFFPEDLENLLAKSAPVSTKPDQTQPEQPAHSSSSSNQKPSMAGLERRGPTGVVM